MRFVATNTTLRRRRLSALLSALCALTFVGGCTRDEGAVRGGTASGDTSNIEYHELGDFAAGLGAATEQPIPIVDVSTTPSGSDQVLRLVIRRSSDGSGCTTTGPFVVVRDTGEEVLVGAFEPLASGCPAPSSEALDDRAGRPATEHVAFGIPVPGDRRVVVAGERPAGGSKPADDLDEVTPEVAYAGCALASTAKGLVDPCAHD